MKKILNSIILIVLFIPFSISSAFSQDSIMVEKVYKNVVGLDGLMEVARSRGLMLDPDDQFFLNRFSSLDKDWNNDGLNDLFLHIAGKPEIIQFSSLFLQQRNGEEIKFVNDENYHIFLEGDAGNIARSVADLNNDGLLDIYYLTQNYHGEPGKQPDYYIEGCPGNTHDKVFINNGNGFNKIEIDDNYGCPTNQPDAIAIDWDQDDTTEILTGMYFYGYIYQSGGGNNIFTSYEFKDTQSYTREYVLEYKRSVEYNGILKQNISAWGQRLIEYNNFIYVALTTSKYIYHPENHVGYVEDNFYSENNLSLVKNDSSLLLEYSEVRILKIDKNDGFDSGIYEEIILENSSLLQNGTPLSLSHDWCFHVGDLNNDGKEEFFLQTIPSLIRIYAQDGSDITSKWLGWSNFEDEFDLNFTEFGNTNNQSFAHDPTFDNSNGIHLVDINYDGRIDIVPQNGWFFNASKIDEVKNYRYFIFINDGNRFIPKQVVFGDEYRNSANLIVDADNGEWVFANGFKFPVDLDNDGSYEILQMRDSWNPNIPSEELQPSNIDIIKLSFDNENYLPPSISSASICDDVILTISGKNLRGTSKVTIGGTDVGSYSVLSNSRIQATIESGQSGTVSITKNDLNVSFSDITYSTSPSEVFVIHGSKSVFKGFIETYIVPESQGIEYEWSFPYDWEIVSGVNTNTVSVKVGSQSGEISVTPSAYCGYLETVSIPVEIYSYTPDDNFQNELVKLGIDKENKPDSVLLSSLQDVEILNLASKNIKDLTGIENFTALTNLDCSDNQLESLDLGKNAYLKELFCFKNNLTSLYLSGNGGLEILRCEENQLTQLDVTQNLRLFALLCGQNSLTNIDISMNTALEMYSIYENKFTNLDLSQNPILRLLHFGSNQLTNLDLSNNLILNELYCNNNQLTSMDLSKHTALIHLQCSDNKLTSLNLKNGNNQNIQTMQSNNNPNLSCINVDNPEQASTYTDWTKDATATYSDNCTPTNIKQHELLRSLKVYPNPVTNELIIKFEGNLKETDFEIVNPIGQPVYNGTIENRTVIPTINFTSGIYLVKLKSGEVFEFRKIIKH